MEALLNRIAYALERQVEQMDEAVERSRRRENEALDRRDADIARIERQHADAIAQNEHWTAMLADVVESLSRFRVEIDTLAARVKAMEV
jgi:hypothetical protein